jgi:hypothetical protein
LLRHVQNKSGEHVLLLVGALKKQFMRASPASSAASISSSAPAIGAGRNSNNQSRAIPAAVGQAGAAIGKQKVALGAAASSANTAAGTGGMSAGAAFLQQAATAAAAERAGARALSSPNPATAAVAAAASGAASSKAAGVVTRNTSILPVGGGAVARVPKQQLLGFIQRWQFDRNVDWCHMKRALATKLVNGAADGAGLVPLDLRRTQMNVAQAGEWGTLGRAGGLILVVAT